MGPALRRVVFACLSLFAAVFACGGGPASAADDLGLGLDRVKSAQAATYVEADEIEHQEQRRMVIGRGNVMIRFGDRILHADEVRVNLERQEFEATGRVLLVEGPSRLEGERLEFNYGTKLGVIYNARGFLYPATSFRGIEIRKVGERVYQLRRGAYTACSVCLSESDLRAWELRAEEGTLIQGESFTAWHASGWLGDTLPVFYSPFVSVPLGPRRSGFLLPHPGYSQKSGFSLRQPFYWAISESQDATITGTYRSKRGFELGADYRYILSANASGGWNGLFLRDRETNLTEKNRWEIHGTHLQNFSPTLSFKADVNFQSDNSIGRDFADRPLAQRTQRAIQSNVFVTQAGEVYNAMLWADVSRDLTNVQDTRLLRVPELRFSLFDRSVLTLPLTFGGNASAAFFERRNLTDAIRADVAPRLRLPWAPVPWLGLTAAAGVRETVYSAGNRGFSGLPSRSLYDAAFDAEARFLRAFDVGWRELSQLVHVVAPRLSYHYVPFVDQQRLPQFDVEDFVSPQNHLTYGLENHFIARLRDAEGNLTSREVLRVGVSQSFNFRPRTHIYSDHYLTALTPERVDNAVINAQPLSDPGGSLTGFSRATERQFTNLVFSAQASPHPLLFLRGDLGYNTTEGKQEVANLQARVRYPGWGYVGVSYTNAADRGLESYTGSVGLSLTAEVSAEYLTRVDARRQAFLEHNMFLRYSTCCWEISLRWLNRDLGPGLGTQNDVLVLFELKTGRGREAPVPLFGTRGGQF